MSQLRLHSLQNCSGFRLCFHPPSLAIVFHLLLLFPSFLFVFLKKMFALVQFVISFFSILLCVQVTGRITRQGKIYSSGLWVWVTRSFADFISELLSPVPPLHLTLSLSSLAPQTPVCLSAPHHHPSLYPPLFVIWSPCPAALHQMEPCKHLKCQPSVWAGFRQLGCGEQKLLLSVTNTDTSASGRNGGCSTCESFPDSASLFTVKNTWNHLGQIKSIFVVSLYRTLPKTFPVHLSMMMKY